VYFCSLKLKNEKRTFKIHSKFKKKKNAYNSAISEKRKGNFGG
jgi:hypothetical protein